MREANAHQSSLRDGARKALVLIPPIFAVGLTFGVLAKPLMGTIAPIVMSIIVFAGASQFAALSVLGAGGGAAAAIAAGALMNSRFLTMGFAIGPSLRGGAARRALEGQPVTDASFAIAHRGEGTFDRGLLLGATIPQACAWIGGTVAGVLAGDVIGDPEAIGLDAVFPAFYLALLVAEMRSHTTSLRLPVLAAIGGAGIALALMPFTPPGIPVIGASLAMLVGLKRS
ncbi:MAG: AzlC family ABC transporter permease [Thermoleophilaceae bacterium]|nr:AzlC family ABC transporter permease [Thermoleophilaceae bacterium]